MPFGARASVLAFIRCTRALQWPAFQIYIINSCYFDDYVVASHEELAKNSEDCFCMLLDLLGWEYDKDGPKSGIMASHVAVLGVDLDLTQTHRGRVVLSNTQKRADELGAYVAQGATSGSLTRAEAVSLRGRMSFAEGQLFGRKCRALFNSLGHYASRSAGSIELSDNCEADLIEFKRALDTGAPRVADSNSQEVLYVLTDAFIPRRNAVVA